MSNARTLTVAVLALTAIGSLGFVSQPARPSRRSGSPIIHRKMEEMDKALDALKEALQAGNTEDALKNLQTMEECVIDAKSQKPAITKDLEPAERDAQNADYRKRLVAVLRDYCDLETLIIDGDTQGASELISGDLHTQEREGHNIFKPKKGDD